MIGEMKHNQAGLSWVLVLIIIAIGCLIGFGAGLLFGSIKIGQCRDRCDENKRNGAYDANCRNTPDPGLCVAQQTAQCKANCNFF